MLAESIPASCRDLGLCFPTNQPQPTVMEKQFNNPGVSQLAQKSLFNSFVGGREEYLGETCARNQRAPGWGAVWSWAHFWPLCALLMPVDLPSLREEKGRGKVPGQQERWICCCGDVLLPKTTLINTGSQNGGVINN